MTFAFVIPDNEPESCCSGLGEPYTHNYFHWLQKQPRLLIGQQEFIYFNYI